MEMRLIGSVSPKCVMGSTAVHTQEQTHIHICCPPAKMDIFNPYTPLGVKPSHVKRKMKSKSNAISETA